MTPITDVMMALCAALGEAIESCWIDDTHNVLVVRYEGALTPLYQLEDAGWVDQNDGTHWLFLPEKH